MLSRLVGRHAVRISRQAKLRSLLAAVACRISRPAAHPAPQPAPYLPQAVSLGPGHQAQEGGMEHQQPAATEGGPWQGTWSERARGWKNAWH